MLQTGDKAPQFKLKNQNEEEISLDDFKGKWVVVYFYPKDSTPGCTKEACEFELLRIVLEQNNAKIGAAAICNGGGGASAIVIERA